MSIRPGWFWHPQEKPHSLKRLFDTYLTSVGANACFNLNLPPTNEGRIDNRDVERLKEFGELLKKEFGDMIPAKVEKIDSLYPTQPKYAITFDKPRNDFKYIILREDIAKGQRVESFQIEAETEGGSRYPFYQGTVIGNCKICRLRDPFEGQNQLTKCIDYHAKRLIVNVTSARDEVVMKEIKVY
ncbi:MAG: alpha-L-fucosidase [Clostridiaceae bacterium]